MNQRPQIRIEMLSNPLYLSGARDLISAVAQRLGFSEASRCQIALAVDEALCNVIRHGYDRRADGMIWMSVWPLADEGSGPGLRIVIEDEARQVDPEKIKGRDLADVKPGGLGVHIIKEVMDEATYDKREGAGMRLTMVKRQHPAATENKTAPAGAERKQKMG